MYKANEILLKKIILIFIFTTSLYSSSFYTLDNVKNVNFYLMSKADYIAKEEKEKITKFVKNKLIKAGFIFGKTDSITIVLKINAIDVDSTYVINIELGLAENVITMRKDQIETFAYTYLSNTMIESDEPFEDTMEYIQFLLYEFIALHKEDNEK